MKCPSITVRLTLLFAAAAVGVFTVVAGGLYFVMRTQSRDNLWESLETRAAIAQSIVQHVTTLEKWPVVRDRLADISLPDRSTLIHIASSDPRFAYGPSIQGDVSQRFENGYKLIYVIGRPYPMLVTTISVKADGQRPELQLTVAIDSANSARTVHALFLSMSILFIVASCVVVLLGFTLSRIGLRPLQRLSDEVEGLRPDNLSHRLGVESLPRELHNLAVAFNAALARLDEAFARLASFNADVAHELRTPIGIVIGETEVALARNRSVDELRFTLQSNLEEFARLKRIVNDMLFLAKADRGEHVKELRSVSLRDECMNLVEFFETLIEDAALSVLVEGDAHVELDVSLFHRALSNLLQNAIEHAPAGTELKIDIVDLNETANLTVSNVGSAIPEGKIGRLFERFYRVEEARTNSNRNHGLGLAIVKAVAAMHGGTVMARSANGLNSFSISLPGSQSAYHGIRSTESSNYAEDLRMEI
ncbi:heavy metal sensor histidine kinase [Paraburkholderia fungorum]|uniref:heavy metal sensor histidine kinase n=1 Tax=Paraburkholderia fungorum TaxID=134537 RepID=UPI000944C8E5|nr:heavy metal sensor histidine kinase [Paraburkholderia fungorum]